jgi:diamine N-acetyltransferase
METFEQKIKTLSDHLFRDGSLQIKMITCDEDLWYAVVECQLAPGQLSCVNPAGFSIGRAYLHPEKNVPCIILHDNIPVGYICLRKSADGSNSWSYYLDQRHQHRGYGSAAARLAVKLLKAAEPHTPIKLSVEKENVKAQDLYRSIGFTLSQEMDGDDLVFIYSEVSPL